jgi:uncharacterized membrane protein
MTRREALLLASRALALYLLCWALTEVTYLPQRLFSLTHRSSVLISRDYLSTYDLVGLWFHALRIVALFATAAWLYRGGAPVEAFFLPPEKALVPGTAESE